MDWLSLETPMVDTKGKIATFWRSRLLENAFPRQFHDNKCFWDLLYLGCKVILFQIFFKYQNTENKSSYITNLEFHINPEIFYPWIYVGAYWRGFRTSKTSKTEHFVTLANAFPHKKQLRNLKKKKLNTA